MDEEGGDYYTNASESVGEDVEEETVDVLVVALTLAGFGGFDVVFVVVMIV